jgi:transcriptional antiterminator NusG
MQAKWYALAVSPARENKVRQNILNRLQKRGITIPELALVCPEEEVFVGRNQERKMRMKLPGYILIHCQQGLPPEGISMIANTAGVYEFLGGNDHPTELPSVEVNKMLGKSVSGQEAPDLYNIGDEVQIIDGPFSDFPAVIKKISNDKRTVTVELEIFGRSTPAQLSVDQIRN